MNNIVSKYQFGSSDPQDLYSSNFFNTIANYLSSQQEPQQEDLPEPEDTPEQEDADYDTEDYDALKAEYDDLYNKYNSLQNTYTKVTSFNDSFLDFLFEDNSNMPMTFPQKMSSQAPSGFRTFGSYQEGRAALENQLKLYQSGKSAHTTGKETLAQATAIYAPPTENDTQNYINFVAKKLGVSPDTPISQIDTKKWADAIEKMEGNKKGNNPGNLRRQTGGVAETPEELYNGLNNNSLDSLTLDLPPQYNLIRGLDSGLPVQIEDELGNSEVLQGPYDLTNMFGKVKEQRL